MNAINFMFEVVRVKLLQKTKWFLNILAEQFFFPFAIYHTTWCVIWKLDFAHLKHLELAPETQNLVSQTLVDSDEGKYLEIIV